LKGLGGGEEGMNEEGVGEERDMCTERHGGQRGHKRISV